jgi:choline-sulfatase
MGHAGHSPQVLASQRRRRFVADALTIGKLKSWDHQPLVDASQQYMRNHIDLDDLERKAVIHNPAKTNNVRGSPCASYPQH